MSFSEIFFQPVPCRPMPTKRDNEMDDTQSESQASVTTETEVTSKSPGKKLQLIPQQPTYRDVSRLLQPHRTNGKICSSDRFQVSSHSGTWTYVDAFVTIPLDERIVVYKCDSLKSVLVSNSLPSTRQILRTVR